MALLLLCLLVLRDGRELRIRSGDGGYASQWGNLSRNRRKGPQTGEREGRFEPDA